MANSIVIEELEACFLGGRDVMVIKVMKEAEIDHNPALEQIREWRYAQKHMGVTGMKVHELGLVFSKEVRNLVRFEWVTR